MLIYCENNVAFDSEEVSSITEVATETKATEGAFAFKMDSEIIMKSGKVLKTPTPVATIIDGIRKSREQEVNADPLMEDLLVQVKKTTAELQAIREFFSRMVIQMETGEIRIKSV